jgi:hypothetical protein
MLRWLALLAVVLGAVTVVAPSSIAAFAATTASAHSYDSRTQHAMSRQPWSNRSLVAAAPLGHQPTAIHVDRTGLLAGVGAEDDFTPPETFVNRHGQLTNGTYTLDEPGMASHQAGSFATGQSQFFSWVDSDTAVLDGAAYADEYDLWVGNKATVPVTNGEVGALGTTGEPTSYINVYRTNTGFVHGSPGTGP